jgi:hypothetical protein
MNKLHILTSSNGCGQIGSKTKRGFQHPYKPFLPFWQFLNGDSASFIKTLFNALMPDRHIHFLFIGD